MSVERELPSSLPILVSGTDHSLCDNGYRIIQILGEDLDKHFKEDERFRNEAGTFYQGKQTCLRIGISVSFEKDMKRWLHISMSHPMRLPTYEEMFEVKKRFIGSERYLTLMVLPPEALHVNDHPYCLHLWSCLDGHPLPEFSRMVNGKRSV